MVCLWLKENDYSLQPSGILNLQIEDSLAVERVEAVCCWVVVLAVAAKLQNCAEHLDIDTKCG
jgi:hypothetical protein